MLVLYAICSGVMCSNDVRILFGGDPTVGSSWGLGLGGDGSLMHLSTTREVVDGKFDQIVMEIGPTMTVKSWSGRVGVGGRP